MGIDSPELQKVKRADVALADGEQRFRTFVDCLPQLVWTARPDGECDYLSPRWADYTGQPESEQLGWGWLEQLHPEDRARAQNRWKESVRNRTMFDIQYRIRRHDGAYRWFATRGIPVGGDGGSVVMWVGSSSDVDDLKRAETEIRDLNAELEQRVEERTLELAVANAQLQAANSELEAFSYSVSHDLRAPLRAITGFGRVMERRHGDQLDEAARGLLGRMCTAAVRMNELLEAMLVLSRVSRHELRREGIDLSALAEEIIVELRCGEPAREVAVSVQEGLRTDGDRQLVRIVLENLLGNAWKFTANNPRARIELGRAVEARREMFVVRDNGAGFDMDFADQLFVPFARLHREDEFPGTGVGLTTVQRIVNRHGGTVRGTSELGQWAAFYFDFGEDRSGRR